MSMYIYLNITLMMLAVLIYGIIWRNQKRLSRDCYYKLVSNKNSVFLFFSFILLAVIFTFRGDFTADYNSYVDFFYYTKNLSFLEVILGSFYNEKGFIMFNKVIGLLTNNKYMYLFVINLVILIPFFREFKKESKYVWLSVLLYINIGPYYTSFNITRQIMAVAIVLIGNKYLYTRNFLRYLLIVFCASLFHRTSLIMIPFYFVLNRNFKIKNVMLVFLSLLLIYLNTSSIIDFIQKFFYSGFTYGMQGGNITSIIVPVAIFIFIMTHSNLVDKNIIKNNILLNSSIFYVFFFILGTRVQMLQRLGEFFVPSILILIPNIVNRIKPASLRVLYIFLIVFFLVLFNYATLSGTGYDPYYFGWDR